MTSWLDRLTAPLAPRWTLKRQRARIAAEMLIRHYEGAAAGRRTAGWNRTAGDANAAMGPAIARLRDVARDLVRNNPYASSALITIVDDVVGWGIVAKPVKTARNRARAESLWKAWAETTACDAEGRQDFTGLEKQVLRTVAQDGECLVRRRWRRPEDRLPIPLQLQLLEPEHLDTMRDGEVLVNGNRIVQGVEFDLIGKRAAYYLFRDHPGSHILGPRALMSDRIPASEILHVFKPERPGQVRAASWFAPVVLRMKDFDDYEDAALMKQKIAACLAVITTDIDGSAPALGTADTTATPQIDELGPGMILNAAPGRSVTVVEPPSVSEHTAYSQTVLRGIAAGLGITYEALTGDFANMPFSAARMSRLQYWAHVEGWRWQLLIPQFCTPVWGWAMEAAAIMGLENAPEAEWTAPPAPMIDPQSEGLAYQRNIRTGIMSLSEAIRERGYDPDTMLEEIAADNKKIDKLGLILDSDARKTTQAGQPRDTAKAFAPAPTDGEPVPANGNGARGHR